jgi:hypothetical protein
METDKKAQVLDILSEMETDKKPQVLETPFWGPDWLGAKCALPKLGHAKHEHAKKFVPKSKQKS